MISRSWNVKSWGACFVSDVARYNNYHPSTKHRLRDRYKATGIVKDRRRSGQPRMVTDVKTATYVDCISTIFTATIFVPAGYCQCQTNRRAPWLFCFRFLIKNILPQLLKIVSNF